MEPCRGQGEGWWEGARAQPRDRSKSKALVDATVEAAVFARFAPLHDLLGLLLVRRF